MKAMEKKTIKIETTETKQIKSFIEVEVPQFRKGADGIWYVNDKGEHFHASPDGLKEGYCSVGYVISHNEEATAEEFLAMLSDAKMHHINLCARLNTEVEELI